MSSSNIRDGVINSMAMLAMDVVGDHVIAEEHPHNILETSSFEADSNLSIKTQDWIESCYNKLHVVSKALDNHLMKTDHEQSSHNMKTLTIEHDHHEHYHHHLDSIAKSVGDPDGPLVSLAHGGTDVQNFTENFTEFCEPDCCHLQDDDYVPSPNFHYEQDLSPLDLKGKRLSKYLHDLRNNGDQESLEPSDIIVPDALSIMDARIVQLKAQNDNGDGCMWSSELEKDQSSIEQCCALDMDTSLQEYLESDKDITFHPLYKRLCAAHISLCKVNHLYSRICAAHIALSKLGATDAQLKEMEELNYELESRLPIGVQTPSSNPKLDKFMNEYCDFLEIHKEEFAKPFDEAMEFCKEIDEELAYSGLKFLRENCPTDQILTNDIIARLQELPFEGEV